VGAEACDDGGTAPGDGCDSSCQIEAGWTCAGEPSGCSVCGDRRIGGTEQCDDGWIRAGDGCDASCQIEAGWTCTGEPSVCTVAPVLTLDVFGAPVHILGLPDWEGRVNLANNGMGGHDITINSTVWSTANNYSLGSSLFTGVPLISNVRITAKNRQGTLQSGYSHTNFVGNGSVVGPYLGGEMPLSGQLVLSILHGFISLTVDLADVGGPAGGVQSPTMLGIPMRITASPWVTGPVQVTGITTNVLSLDGVTGAGINLRPTPNQHAPVLSTGGGYVTTGGGLPMEYHTVTISGRNGLPSASWPGTITLVAPMRVDTTNVIVGRTPATARMRLTFVPEPQTLLLLVTGAIGLALVGWGRIRM